MIKLPIINRSIQLLKSFLHIKAKKIETIISYFDNHLWNVGIQKNYYLNQQDQLLPYLDILSHHLYKTNNDSQNHIINMLYQYFKEEYPQVHSHIDDQVLGTITMDDSKLSSLIYNLFKNSFEASSNTTDKSVSISLKNKNNNLYIQIKNSIDRPVTLKEGYTSKENKNDHGIGLTIINEIVDEYHGINQYQQTDQCLVNDIILFDVIH